jgi:hypothetical protein
LFLCSVLGLKNVLGEGKKVATALVISLQRRSGIEIENVCLFGNVFGILL